MFTLIRFVSYLFSGDDDGFSPPAKVILELLTLGIFPVLFLMINTGHVPDCCNVDEINPFNSLHLLSIFVWYLLVVMAYWYVMYYQRTGPPLLEVAVNWTLLFGIVLNVGITLQTGLLGVLFSCPIILLLLIALSEKHRRLTGRSVGEPVANSIPTLDKMLITSKSPTVDRSIGNSDLNNWLAESLVSIHLVKQPFIFIIGLPFFIVVDTILLMFGQQPDSVVLAFTQTYKLPLSTLDAACINVSCGDHYLCSIAANGHPVIVKPLRMGTRHGHPIICNRQLLVANAFEELIQEQLPATHRLIRRHYDRVGNFIHKDYTPYQNPWLCDLIYLLMKPADWFFRFVLYTFDCRPEERIARQYLPD